MQQLPLHPAIVHLPIGVAVVVPIIAVFALVAAIRRGRLERRHWASVVLLQAVVLGGALVAMRTGEAEEERVEDIVSERILETHEERGEVFTWLAGMALAAGVAALVIPTRRAQLAAAAAASVAAMAVGGAAYWVGYSGGELVYKNGAAAAYSSAAVGTAREQGREEEDD